MTAKAKQPSEQKAGELKKDGKDPTACAWGISEQEGSQQAQKKMNQNQQMRGKMRMKGSTACVECMYLGEVF